MTETLLPFFHWLHGSTLGQFIENSSWAYTVALIIHFTGMSMLFGGMLVIDLRLLGVTRQIPLNAVLALLPVAIAGFAANLLTGILFFAFDPVSLWNNIAFKAKIVLIVIAGLNALWFTLVEEKHLKVLPAYGDTTAAMKFTAALSLILWTLVIVCGRMIVGVAGIG